DSWIAYFFQAGVGIRDFHVTGVQTCALPILQGFEAGGELYDNFVKQRVQRGYGFMLVSTTNNIATLRTDLQGALLGWQQAATDNPFNYQAGAPAKLPGGLYAWRDMYFDSGYISE